MAFTFSAEQREQLLAALERSDSGAWHLTEDVEAAIEAYGQSIRSEPPAGQGAGHRAFAYAQELITKLRAALYELPEEAHRISALDFIADDHLADINRLAHASGDALERLALKLNEVAQALPKVEQGPYALAERFIRALGQAFRNRLNIKPTPEAGGLFRNFLDAVIVLTRGRHADIDELSRVLTEARLARILES